MRTPARRFIAYLLALTPGLACATPHYYTVVPLHIPGPWNLYTSINAHGDIAGTTLSASGFHAYLYADGKTNLLGPADKNSQGNAMNDAGQVAGRIDPAAGSFSHAAVMGIGTSTDYGTLGGDFASAYGINNHGTVVGVVGYTDPRGPRGFMIENGVVTDLGRFGGDGALVSDINDAGQIIGYSYGVNGRAFITDGHGHTTYLPEYGSPYDINEQGHVVGAGVIDDTNYGFLYRDGVMTNLGTLPFADYTWALGVNAFDQVVGVSGGGKGGAFLWDEGRMFDLNRLARDSAWQIDFATSINDGGQIAAWGCAGPGPDPECSVLLLNPAEPVPEPSAAAMLLTGCCAGAVWLRRRARRRVG